MKITIKATRIKLSPALYNYIEEKISRLRKFLKNIDEDIVEARIEIGRPSRHHQKGDVYYAEANIHLPKKILRAEAEEWDLRAAVDKIKDELERRLKEHRNKQATENRRREMSFKKAKAISPLARFRKKKKYIEFISNE